MFNYTLILKKKQAKMKICLTKDTKGDIMILQVSKSKITIYEQTNPFPNLRT